MNRGWVFVISTAALSMCLGVAGALAGTAVEFDRATRLAMAEDYEGALAQYEAFLDRAPTDRLAPVAASAMASIQLEVRQDTTAALAALDRVLSDHRDSRWAPEAARRKGACAEARGSWETAAESYQLAADLAMSTDTGPGNDWINEVTVAAANCFYEAGDPQQVIATYERVLAGTPPPEVAAAAIYRLGESYETADDRRQAAEHYRQVVERYPSSPLFMQAMEKRPLIDAEVEMNWQPFEVYSEGTALINQRDFPGALAKCDELDGLLQEHDNPALRECATYRRITLETVQSGDFSGGCQRLEQFIEQYPDGLRTETARTTLAERWTPIADQERLVKEHPDDAAMVAALGTAYVQAGAMAPGIEMLEQAVALDPERDAAHMTLGQVYMQSGRTDDAVRAFGNYLERNPNDTMALNLMGYSLLGGGEAERAIPYFERYAEVAPDDANAHDSLGEGYLTAGRLEDAAREYEEAVRIDSDFTNSHFMLGRVYREMGRTDEAVRAYQHFLTLIETGPQADQARAAIAELGAPAGQDEGSQP